MATNAVSRTLFRSLLRSARKLDGTIPSTSVAAELASLSAPSAASSASSFTEAVKAGFRANRAVTPNTPEFKGLVDGAFTFLQAANKRSAALTSATSTTTTTSTPPSVPLKPSEVVYSVGQVFRHRTYGYKAVIIGWDTCCKASPEWVASTGTARLPRGTQQPFYHCLVDIRDRPEAQVSYVAQDNIDATFVADDEGAFNAASNVVVHPLAAKYFSGFSTTKGYFLPNAALQNEYPRDDASTITIKATASRTARKVTVTTTTMMAAAISAPSAVRGGISNHDLILKAALRNAAAIKAQREARSAAMAAAASASASNASSSSDSEGAESEETAEMA